MTDSVLKTAIVAAWLAPAVAVLIAVLPCDRLTKRTSLVLASVVSLAAALVILIALTAEGIDSVTVPSASFRLTSDGLHPLVPGELFADRLSGWMLLLSSTAVCVILVGCRRDDRTVNATGRRDAEFALLVWSTNATLLAGDFLSLAVFWVITSLVSSLSAAQHRSRAMKLTTISRLAGDAVLLIGVLFVVAVYGSSSYRHIFSFDDASTDVSPVATSVIAMCFTAGFAGRCALFPLSGWLHHYAHRCGPTALAFQTALVIPSAAYLLLRSGEWLSGADGDPMPLVAFGAVAGVVSASIAAAQRTSRGALAYSATSCLAWIPAAAATGSAGAATVLIATVTLVHAVLLPRVSTGRSIGAGAIDSTSSAPVPFVVSLIIVLPLLTGCAGQALITGRVMRASGILASTNQEVRPERAASPGSFEPANGSMSHRRIDTVVFGWMLMAGLGLNSLAIVRALLRFRFSPDEPDAHAAPSGISTLLLAAMTSSVGLCGLAVLFPTRIAGMGRWLSNGSRWSHELTVHNEIELCAVAGLLGTTIAWTFCNGHSRILRTVAKWLDVFIRPARHRFLLDQVIDAVITRPIRAAVICTGLLDRSLFGRLAAGAAGIASRGCDLFTRPFDDVGVRFDAIAFVTALVLVLASFLA